MINQSTDFFFGTICILSAAIYLSNFQSLEPKANVGTTVETSEGSSKGTLVSDKSNLPNIVFILADDLGHNDVGFSYVSGGHHNKIETPRIDSIATRQGTVILDQCYSMRKCPDCHTLWL